MKLHLRGSDPMNFKGDLLILGHFSSVCPLSGYTGMMDWVLNASISRLWKEKPDLLDFGKVTLLASQGKVSPGQVLLLGLGEQEAFTRRFRKEAYGLGFTSAAGLGARKLALEAFPVKGDRDSNIDEDLLAAYDILGNAVPEVVYLYIDSPEVLTSLGDRIRGAIPDFVGAAGQPHTGR